MNYDPGVMTPTNACQFVALSKMIMLRSTGGSAKVIFMTSPRIIAEANITALIGVKEF